MVFIRSCNNLAGRDFRCGSEGAVIRKVMGMRKMPVKIDLDSSKGKYCLCQQDECNGHTLKNLLLPEHESMLSDIWSSIYGEGWRPMTTGVTRDLTTVTEPTEIIYSTTESSQASTCTHCETTRHGFIFILLLLFC